MPDLTTIKVPKALRESLMRSARAEGLSSGGVLWSSSRRSMPVSSASQPSATPTQPLGETADYDEIDEAWNEAIDDGLDDA